MIEAQFYTKHKNNSVKCQLCPHRCEIKQNSCGLCRVRKNINGILYTETYNKISSIAIDPIEKKPLSNYKPNSQILSVGTWGCNLKCKFCQNHRISQLEPELNFATPEDLLKLSLKYEESIGIAFTYNEPTIWYEYIFDVAKNNPKDTILVTNGFINPDPLGKLLPYIDAMNIDIKSMNPNFYKNICAGNLRAVQETIKISAAKTHVELTFLAIPGLNNSPDEMHHLVDWISSIDKKIPLHIIPFRPMYKMMDVPYQTITRLKLLQDIAAKKLIYVY